MGIADCHGIESFIPFDVNCIPTLFKRTEANRQRHAVFYVVNFSDTDNHIIGEIEECMKNGEYKEALIKLKRVGEISFPKGRADLYSKSWKLIPNPDLDPWR